MKLTALLSAPPISVNTDDLEDLIRRSRCGDLDAFNTLVHRYYGVTYGMAYRMLGSREAAEDATQDVFLKAWRNIERFRGAASFSTWLHTIAVNQCLSVVRKNRTPGLSRAVSLEGFLEERRELELPDSGGFNPDDWAMQEAIKEAIAKLPDKLRIVVTLRYFGHIDVEEIAEALSIPPRTVRSRLHLAMKRLRCRLDHLEER